MQFVLRSLCFGLTLRVVYYLNNRVVIPECS